MKIPKKCEDCGTEFIAKRNHERARWCSPECSRKNKNKKILNTHDKSIIIERDVSTIKELVEIAVKEKISLYRANLEGADLIGADLRGANLCKANLIGANLIGADLEGANLCRANLIGADLCKADLCRANLCRANLYKADLYRANLSGATLCIADLRGADLEGADLVGASLEGANLSGASLLCTGNMKEIRTMQIDTYRISFTKETLQIGCKRHLIEEWKSFSDEEISKMDGTKNTLGWWNKWKEHIFKAIELSFKKDK